MWHVDSPTQADPTGLADITHELTKRLDDVVQRVQNAIRREVGLYHDGAMVSPDEMTETIRSHLLLVFETLGSRSGYDVGAATRTGARRAAAGIPFGVVEHSYRVAAAEIWHIIGDEAERLEGRISTHEVMAAASDVWLMHEQFSAAASEGYRAEVAIQVSKREFERSSVIDALMEARIVDQMTIWEAADILGISRRGPYVAAAVETGRSVRELDVDRQLADRGFSSAWRLGPDAAVGIVTVNSGRQVATLARALTRQDGPRIGLSPVYSDLGETAHAVRWARTAMTASRGGADSVVVFDRSPLAVASVAAPEIMKMLSAQVLAPVLDLPSTDRDVLLDTLETWMRQGASATTTATLLFCHANTVRSRLRRIEMITGRSLRDPVQLAELCLALESERRLGAAATV